MKAVCRLVYPLLAFVLIGTTLCSIASASSITNEGVRMLVDIQCEASPNYSPDGNSIVYSMADYSGDPNKASIWILNPATLEKNQVNIPDSQYLDYVDWHPNGKQIIFTQSVFHTPGTSKIYTINIDGTGKTPLAQDNDPGDAHYSPDGSKIVYMTRVSGPTSNLIIWRMDADGNNKIKLTDSDNEEMRPRFSPDGTKIVYSSGSSSYSNIWIMDSNGQNKKQITFDNVLESAPVWSPDGKYIAFQKSPGVGQPWNIWVMKADGSEQTQLTDYSKDGIDGGSPSWSPDGKKLVFSSGGANSQNNNWHIYEMTLGIPSQSLIIIQKMSTNIQELITIKQLNSGQGDSLISKLDAARTNINNKNSKDAANQLNAFINEVSAYMKTGKLSASIGQALIDEANDVIKQLISEE